MEGNHAKSRTCSSGEGEKEGAFQKGRLRGLWGLIFHVPGKGVSSLKKSTIYNFHLHGGERKREIAKLKTLKYQFSPVGQFQGRSPSKEKKTSVLLGLADVLQKLKQHEQRE